MIRFRLIVVVAALTLVSSSSVCRAAEATRRPNVLFVMVDEMRWNAMSCAANTIVKTPNLDRLAMEGTRFGTAYTVAPICTPSRYSLFTSRYAHVHGSTTNGIAPTEPLVVLPTVLKHYGYQTAISGKLHFVPNDRDYDFDYFWSFANEGPHKLPTWPEYMAAKYPAAKARAVEMRPFADDPLGKDLGKLPYAKEDFQSDWLTSRAIDFLKQRDKDKPFFLYVSYLDPHSPSHLSDPYWGMFNADEMPLPPSFHQDPNKPERTADNRHEVNNPLIVKALTAAYYAKMVRVDDNVGRLLGELKAMGLADDTLIVFTADHGNMLGDLNRWFKGVMYEGSTRVPLMIKAPPARPELAAKFNRGRVVERIVENVDVMPTVCEMIGVPLPKEGIQGRSMTGLVGDKPVKWKDRAFAERGTRMVRTPQYKLIWDDRRAARPYELYDLTVDPREEHDLAKDAGHAEVLKQLAAEMDAWQKDKPPVPVYEGITPMKVEAAGDPKAGKRRGKVVDE